MGRLKLRQRKVVLVNFRYSPGRTLLLFGADRINVPVEILTDSAAETIGDPCSAPRG